MQSRYHLPAIRHNRTAKGFRKLKASCYARQSSPGMMMELRTTSEFELASCTQKLTTPTRPLQAHTHTRTDEGLASTMRVKRPHTSLLAAGATLMATADDGFWEDEDEAHDWTCVGVALMAVACVKGKRRRSILGNNYDPMDLMGEESRDRFLFLRRRRKRRKLAVVGVCLHQLLACLPRRLSSYQQMTDETPESAEDIMGMLSDRHFYEYFRFTKQHFTELCDYLKIPDYFRCGMQNKQYVSPFPPTLEVPEYGSLSFFFPSF